MQRFPQEARAASALNHPNVCTILALGETAEGQHYIAMEYVEGETLRQRLSTSRLTIREALDFAIQVAAARLADRRALIQSAREASTAVRARHVAPASRLRVSKL